MRTILSFRQAYPGLYCGQHSSLGVAIRLILVLSFAYAPPALPSGVDKLDSESRRAVREAQMSRFSNRDQGKAGSAQAQSGVVVQNSSRGQKGKCTTQVGHVTNYGNQHGTRINQITVVEGSVVNVCD